MEHVVSIALCGYAVRKCFGIKLWINVGDLKSCSHVVSVIIIIVYGKVRLSIVKPEHVDTVVVVVFLAFFPDKFSGFRIGHIDYEAVALKII